MQLFVYYKLVPTHQADVKVRVARMQAELQKQFQISEPQLLKRPEPDELGRETWMEVYDLTGLSADLFKAQLERASVSAGLPQPRRNELFVSC